MFSLVGKLAIVTGSEGGIGGAIIRGYMEAGAIICGIDILEGIRLDVTDTEPIKKLFKNIELYHKKIDILVNCAGITLPEQMGTEVYTDMDWDKTLAVNLTAPWKLSQMVFPYMKETGGSIINITSIASERGLLDNPAYGAAKGGLKILTKCLAVDWAKYGIRVNNLGFSYIKTNMTKKSWDDPALRKQRTDRIPLGRWGEPEDTVGAAIFLASDASKYVTGQDLYVDGGFLSKGL